MNTQDKDLLIGFAKYLIARGGVDLTRAGIGLPKETGRLNDYIANPKANAHWYIEWSKRPDVVTAYKAFCKDGGYFETKVRQAILAIVRSVR